MPNEDGLPRAQSCFGLFLLPGGLPLRFTAVIHFGGRPRRLPRPTASLSKVKIASELVTLRSQLGENFVDVHSRRIAVCEFPDQDHVANGNPGSR